MEAEADVRGFLEARAWTSSDGQQALFDCATAWLIEHKVLPPGVTVLGRTVTAIRAEASERLWQQLNDSIDPELRCRMDALLTVEDGSRFSALEHLRTSPTRLSGPEMVRRSSGWPKYGSSAPFVPLLTEVIRFGAVEDTQTVLKAVRRLGELLGRKKVKAD